MAKHAKYSASGSARWLNCPGSIRLEQDAPPETESIYAVEGTTAHELLAVWVSMLAWGSKFKPSPKWPKEMVSVVGRAVTEIKTQVSSIENVEVEEKVSLSYIHEDMAGTADIVDPEEKGTLTVLDYKHGQGHLVHVKTDKGLNTQLVFYALGAAAAHAFKFKRVKLGIVQPRTRYKGGFARYETVSMGTLRAYEDLFKRGVDRCEKKNARLYVGSWCFFCKARTICPEANKKHIAEAREAFNG